MALPLQTKTFMHNLDCETPKIDEVCKIEFIMYFMNNGSNYVNTESTLPKYWLPDAGPY